jgi:hypothetical protein
MKLYTIQPRIPQKWCPRGVVNAENTGARGEFFARFKYTLDLELTLSDTLCFEVKL